MKVIVRWIKASLLLFWLLTFSFRYMVLSHPTHPSSDLYSALLSADWPSYDDLLQDNSCSASSSPSPTQPMEHPPSLYIPLLAPITSHWAPLVLHASSLIPSYMENIPPLTQFMPQLWLYTTQRLTWRHQQDAFYQREEKNFCFFFYFPMKEVFSWMYKICLKLWERKRFSQLSEEYTSFLFFWN